MPSFLSNKKLDWRNRIFFNFGKFFNEFKLNFCEFLGYLINSLVIVEGNKVKKYL